MFWLISLDAKPSDIEMTSRACEASHLPFAVVPVAQVRERLTREQPSAAVLHGGRPSPPLIDAQRWLADAGVPTLVLLLMLTDDLEAILLDRGAQDVLPFPVSERRLGARLRLLGRSSPTQHDEADEIISLGGAVTLSPRSRVVCVGDRPVSLTKSEFDLLLTVALRRGSVVEHRDLAVALDHDHLSTRALQTHASRVRSKLLAVGAPDVLVSVRGIGYRLRE